MPLTFPDDFDFIGITARPRQQFVLDQITRRCKSAGATEEEVLAATGLPAVGDAHPLFANMFVTSLGTSESGENACVLSVDYTGSISGNATVITIANPGSGYTDGIDLFISSGGQFAWLSVSEVDMAGAITAFTVEASTFTSDFSGLPAVGGTGSGATFDVIGGSDLILPAQQHDTDDPIESASSSYGATGNAAQSITVQYHAPTNILSYISAGAPGTTDADDPTDDPVVTAVVVGGINFTPGSIPSLLSNFFTPNTVTSKTAKEIVAGKYWQNVSKKTKGYLPYVFTAPAPGTVYIALASPGQDYSVGNILTITAGGESASLRVTALGIGQSVLTFEVVTNSFTVQQLLVSATGGSGSLAVFNVNIL